MNQDTQPDLTRIYPGTRVLCRAANNGHGARILILQAAGKVWSFHPQCPTCPYTIACGRICAALRRKQ